MANRRKIVFRSTSALLVAGFAALIGIVTAAMWLGHRAEMIFDEVIAARDQRFAATELRDALLTAETSQRGYLYTGNEIYLAPFNTAKFTAERQFDAMRKSLSSNREMDAIVQRLGAIVTEKIDEMGKATSLKSNRQDAEALALMRTNRGKALMDEANVFLSGIIQSADARLTEGVSEEKTNASLLRWISSLGALAIVIIVGGVVASILSYARELRGARDEMRALNLGLEERVRQRTQDLAGARDRAEALLQEVNHRVANSLSLVSALVGFQARAVPDRKAKDALEETKARIQAVALVHKKLYGSSDVTTVKLDEYLASLLDNLGATMRNEGHGASINYDIAPISLRPDASVNLGVVVTEWVTNAYKYAYPQGRGSIRVGLKNLPDGQVELVVDDDGVGRSGEIKGTGVGTRIVTAMASTMGGEIQYHRREPGTRARLVFSPRAA